MLQIKEEDEKKSSWRRRVNDTPETETKKREDEKRGEGRRGKGRGVGYWRQNLKLTVTKNQIVVNSTFVRKGSVDRQRLNHLSGYRRFKFTGVTNRICWRVKIFLDTSGVVYANKM